MPKTRSIVALVSIAAIAMLSACDLATILDRGSSSLCADMGQGHCPTEAPGDP